MINKKPYVLESVVKTTPDVFTFRFRSQDGEKVDFTPGMFAMLYWRNKDTGEEIGRSYSIASSPNADYFDFIITMIHGMLTSKLEDAKPGDVYYISAPYGQFKIEPNSGGKLLFLAGGTGIVPFISLMKYTESTDLKLDISMICSIRYPYEMLCRDTLDEMKERKELRLAVTVTRPQPGDDWTGQTGRIDADMIKKYVPDVSERVCYICGPMAFVNALKAALTSMGIDGKSIKAEMWGE
ncbi:Sulfhydrogenase 1 subunit gamma [uncultured archaeon]|nr:Sulfhydrogenase 1 subunit gamma [uncultured archaeon]